MARDFTNTTADYLKKTSVLSTATDNLTMCAWARMDTMAATRTIFLNGYDDGVSGGTGYHLRASSASKFRITISFVASLNSTTTLSTGTWYHLLTTCSSGTWRLYINGVDDGVSLSATPATPSVGSAIGTVLDSGANPLTTLDGQVGECAMWERVLTQAEITALAAGYAPSFFLRSLVSYAPVIGKNSPEQDLKNGTSFTVGGTTAYPHPRIIYPSRPQIILPPAAVVAGQPTIKRIATVPFLAGSLRQRAF